MSSQTVTITIDGKALQVEAGTTVFEAARQHGIEIPHFCYHPKLSIAGNCRLCQVEVEGAKGPVISCRERVRDGMVVRVTSEGAVQVRKDVLEYILINHPLDCPVCDQSGECKLQDQYFDHSLQASRMKLPKVHKPKAIPIGPYVALDDERCVLCTRCIRFCDEVAGEHQLMLRERGDHSTIDVAPGEQLDNPYSLCAADICPVGALTSLDFRFKKRVWFLSSTPSICTGCATGCNIWMDHADGIVYRYRPRDNETVNQCWLCDAGRMTYKPINAETRLLFPHAVHEGALQRLTWYEAIARAQTLLKTYAPHEVAGILSANASLEENMGMVRFLRDAIGTNEFFWAGFALEPEFGDKILRDADRNANSNGVTLLSAKRFGKDVNKGIKAYIVLGNLSSHDLDVLLNAKPEMVIACVDTLSSEKPWANLFLPCATHAEQEGLLVNRQMRLQRFARAFLPRGESLPGWQIAARLAAAFGKDIDCTSSSAVFEAEKRHYEKLQRIEYASIPNVGVAL